MLPRRRMLLLLCGTTLWLLYVLYITIIVSLTNKEMKGLV